MQGGLSCNWLIVIICALALALPISCQSQEDTIVLAFASCSKVDEDQHLWDEVLEQQPDYWFWLGDNIYGDSKDVNVLRKKYARQLARPDYQRVISQVPITGTWDDHDYGVNDGDKRHPTKAASRDAFFDFIGIPEDHEARNREGAYHDFLLEKDQLSVHAIFLDVRYFKDPVDRVKGTYVPDSSAGLLGEEQWLWLENKMSSSDADVIVISSGLQVLSYQHRFEKWANHPSELERLEALAAKVNTPVVLLSGDRHRAEIMSKELPNGLPLIEITSSSFTHAYPNDGEPNEYRIGPLVMVNNFGTLRLCHTDSGLRMTAKIISEGSAVESEYQHTYLAKED